MCFKNKTVIVTGASVGIGKVTAMEFAKQGSNVCIVDMDEQKLMHVKNEIEKITSNVSAYVCDITNEERVHEVTEAAIASYGKVDILVNNAGLWRFFCPFLETSSDEWKKIFNVNILGTMYFSQAVLGTMVKNKYGRIINVGSVAGVYGNANMAAYSASKGAISSFTKALAKEVAQYGVTVNNVVPGSVRNEGTSSESELSFMGRAGELEEYAYLICFLASDKAAYISGQDYQIDGCRKKM